MLPSIRGGTKNVYDKFESYSQQKVDPFFSKLLNAIYKDGPKDVELYTKFYLGNNETEMKNIEKDDLMVNNRHSLEKSSMIGIKKKEEFSNIKVSEPIKKKNDFNEESEKKKKMNTTAVELPPLSPPSSTRKNRKHTDTGQLKTEKARSLVSESDTIGSLKRKQSFKGQGEKEIDTKKMLNKLVALKKQLKEGKGELTSEDIDFMMDFALRSASDSFTVPDIKDLNDFKSFETKELDAFKSYIIQNFTTTGTEFSHVNNISFDESGTGGEDIELSSETQIKALTELSGVHKSCTHLVESFVGQFYDWNFDIFELAKIMGSPLVFVGYASIRSLTLCRKLKLNIEVYLNFVFEIQNGYIATNPYHNALHAADVTHAVHYFLSVGGLLELIDDEMQLAMIMSGMIHDIGHPALSNSFLTATEHELSIRYNDLSVLENFHCSMAFQIMRKSPNFNVLSSFNSASRSRIRRACISSVLGTDNALHSKYLSKLKAKIDTGSLNMEQSEDMLLVMKLSLHAADVSNPSKEMKIYKKWTLAIVQEFFAQGDRERELGLPISPGMDRINPIPTEKMQAGFIHALCLPLYRALNEVADLDVSECVQKLEENLAIWHTEIAKNNKET